jgi:delta 1-pyrroline-5-carboxylate dehydrogenase
MSYISALIVNTQSFFNMSASIESSFTFDRFSNIINGKPSDTAATRHGVNPSTREPLAAVPVSGTADVDLAVSAAKAAAVGWGAVPLADRQKAVNRYADALEAKTEDFATLLVREQGKPVRFVTMFSFFFPVLFFSFLFFFFAWSTFETSFDGKLARRGS